MATIYDKDILIYCISQLIAKRKRGEPISRRLKMKAYDLLLFTNRGTAGKDYESLCSALDRLDSTRIRTNIKRGEDEKYTTFGLLESASVSRKFGIDGRLQWCEITLSEWVFNAVNEQNVLTLHRDYFRLRKPLERRIYEIARKHCGRQPEWSCGVSLLLKKSGSKSNIRHFRYLLKSLVKNDHLPDYSVSYDEDKDKVIFVNRNTQPVEISKSLEVDIQVGPLKPETYEEGREFAPGWDIYELEREWRKWMTMCSEPPRDPDAAFLGFCRKWYEKRGDA